VKEYSKILVIGPGHIGDLLRITPALQILRRTYPNSFISVLTKSRSEELLATNPDINEIYTCEKKSLPWYSLKGFLLVRRLKRCGFDLAILYSDNRYLNDLVDKLGVPDVVKGYYQASCNVVDRNIQALEQIGVKGVADRLVLNTPSNAMKKVKVLLKKKGYDGVGPLVGVQVGTRGSSRTGRKGAHRSWAPDRMGELCQTLIKERGVTIALFGYNMEKLIAKEITSYMSDAPLNFCNELSLLELVAITKMCDLFISCDTGPMHIAASQQTPIVALFGPTREKIAGPYMDPKKYVVVKKEIDCSPCQTPDCETYECMDNLKVEDALAGIEMLDKRIGIFSKKSKAASESSNH